MGVVTRAKKRMLDEESSNPQLAPRGGEDLISRLPDDILISILPSKDAARTQMLLRRWQLLWQSAPLNLEAMVDSSTMGKDVTTIDTVLQAHRGRVRRFSLSWTLDYNHFFIFPMETDCMPNFPHLKELTLSNINIVVGERGGAARGGRSGVAGGECGRGSTRWEEQCCRWGERRGTTGRRERWPAVEGGRGKMN
uniref:F-box domain-containing protein n=1 Tax=Oryza barthii TaxID=65489 RepID=A0A0D3HVM7_9ORYZ